MRRRRLLRGAALLAAGSASSALMGGAHAAPPGNATSNRATESSVRWPGRPVNVVVPFAAGSSPDTLARILCAPLAKALGQAVTIDNRPGEGGNQGSGDVARANGDGYTFLYTIQGPLVTAPLLYKNLSYDPFEDLAPVTLVATSPNIMVVDPALGTTSLSEFVRIAKERKGQLRYGSIGIGSAAHLAMELFKSRAGLEIAHVVFQGLPEVVAGIQAGQVQAAIMVPAVAIAPVRAGTLKSLGVTALGRVASLPEMPTFAEQGFPGFEAIAWHAVMAPESTPHAAIERMSAELVRIIKSDDVRARLLAQYFSAAGTAPEALAGLMQTERNRWAKVIRAANVKMG